MGHFKCIDILKGIGMILMVMGHAGFPHSTFVYLFHMAIFFIASGYCWNKENSGSIEKCKKYIFRKIKTLYVPYVICNITFLMLNNLFIKIGIYTANPDFLTATAKMNGEYSWDIGSYMSGKDLIWTGIKVLLFRGGTQLGGATWFLRTLFVVTVGHCIYEFLIIKANSRIRIFLIGIMCLLCSTAYELYRRDIINGLYTDMIINFALAYIVYVLGMLFRYLEKKGLIANVWTAIAGGGILLLCNQFGHISMSSVDVTNSIYFVVVSLCGWCLTLWVSKSIENSWLGVPLSYLGKHTMPIITLHFLCFKLVTYLYLLCSHKPILLLAYFPALRTEKWLWVFYTLAGIMIPVGIDRVYHFLITKKK